MNEIFDEPNKYYAKENKNIWTNLHQARSPTVLNVNKHDDEDNFGHGQHADSYAEQLARYFGKHIRKRRAMVKRQLMDANYDEIPDRSSSYEDGDFQLDADYGEDDEAEYFDEEDDNNSDKKYTTDGVGMRDATAGYNSRYNDDHDDDDLEEAQEGDGDYYEENDDYDQIPDVVQSRKRRETGYGEVTTGSRYDDDVDRALKNIIRNEEDKDIIDEDAYETREWIEDDDNGGSDSENADTVEENDNELEDDGHEEDNDDGDPEEHDDGEYEDDDDDNGDYEEDDDYVVEDDGDNGDYEVEENDDNGDYDYEEEDDDDNEVGENDDNGDYDYEENDDNSHYEVEENNDNADYEVEENDDDGDYDEEEEDDDDNEFGENDVNANYEVEENDDNSHYEVEENDDDGDYEEAVDGADYSIDDGAAVRNNFGEVDDTGKYGETDDAGYDDTDNDNYKIEGNRNRLQDGTENEANAFNSNLERKKRRIIFRGRKFENTADKIEKRKRQKRKRSIFKLVKSYQHITKNPIDAAKLINGYEHGKRWAFVQATLLTATRDLLLMLKKIRYNGLGSPSNVIRSLKRLQPNASPLYINGFLYQYYRGNKRATAYIKRILFPDTRQRWQH